jgi:hypothetical protein
VRGLGVGFDAGETGAAEVDAVVLCAGLEEEAGRVEVAEGEGAEEVAQQGGVYLDELVGVGPGAFAFFGWRLKVGVEEDVWAVVSTARYVELETP